MAELWPINWHEPILVDAYDFEKLKHYTFEVIFCRGRPTGVRVINTSLARSIMKPQRGMEVDHINRNPLDNRRANLRICTKEENARNKGFHRGAEIPFKGVCKSRNKYRARYKGKHLGTFDTAEEAAMAYDEYLRALYPDCSYTYFNFSNLEEQG